MLADVNIEFRKLYAMLGKRALPIVKLVEHDKPFPSKHAQGMLMPKGKKARVLL
jgi:hypothetical protein